MVSAREVEENLRRIFKRCVKCPPGAPACPPCASDETCSLQAESCNSCATTTCVAVGSLPGQASTSSGTPIGPIVGGVVGGVAAIVLITWLVWRFCIRNRRKAYDEQIWSDAKVEKRDTTRLSGRAQSTRSVASMASTVLTRASNVIQIAYIPGVTNRSPPDSPALAPPVPPIPSAMSSPRFAQDAHFFMPGDLRDSTYSDMTQDQRNSMAPSITPSLARASVATTIYGANAVLSPEPAQRAFFRMGAPNVVSVKSGATTPGSTSGQSANTPPVPRVPKQHIGSSSIIGQNLKPRPIEVRKNSSKTNVPTLANLAKAASPREGSLGFTSQPYSEEKEVLFTPTTSNLIDASATTTPALLPKPSFFSEASDRSSQISAILPAKGPLGHNHANTNSTGDSSALNAMIEDALNRAAAVHTPQSGRPSLHKHSSTESGPFSDSNAMKENDMSR